MTKPIKKPRTCSKCNFTFGKDDGFCYDKDGAIVCNNCGGTIVPTVKQPEPPQDPRAGHMMGYGYFD